MQKKKKLEERLAACGSGGHVFPAVCWLDTICYFYALEDMRGGSYYSNIYNCMALGNVDNAEIEEMISTPGMAIISKLGRDKSDSQYK